jgi:hypothetical protein
MKAMKTSAALTALAPLLLVVSLTGCGGATAAPAPDIRVQDLAAENTSTAHAPGQDNVGSEALAQLATIEIIDTIRPLTPEQSAVISKNPPMQVETGPCADARRYTALKAKYHLSMTRSEHDTIESVLNTCG